jgi:anti-sigma-K factor RskA
MKHGQDARDTKMREELEYSISQYLDGTLPPLERAALEQKLASDADARAVLAEYQKLDAVLKQSRMIDAPPALDWDRLASEISTVLEGVDAPVRNYSMKWVRYASVAVAAMVLIAIGIATRFSNPTTAVTPQAVAVIQVSGPRADVATETSSAQVAIGPPSQAGEQIPRYGQAVVYRPARVVIASGLDSAQDTVDSNGLY